MQLRQQTALFRALKIITWRTFNLEYLFVYEFESTFLSDCIFCVSSSNKKINGTTAR